MHKSYKMLLNYGVLSGNVVYRK